MMRTSWCIAAMCSGDVVLGIGSEIKRGCFKMKCEASKKPIDVASSRYLCYIDLYKIYLYSIPG